MQGYVWLDAPGKRASDAVVLPPLLARPYADVANLLDMPPVLTYATYVLANWQLYAPRFMMLHQPQIHDAASSTDPCISLPAV